METNRLAGAVADFSRISALKEPMKLDKAQVFGGSRQVSAGGENAGDQEQAALDKESISNAVAHLNDYMQKVDRKLSFSMNDALGKIVIEVKDAETDEVIRSIPPKEIIEFAERLQESGGLLVKEQA
ncbi:MAG: hypothetical protein AXA67_09670 [Methylothermaceae bacteria B42]|nr:MAG: hypothetical protein AXA67_09670 [Methylothermaceae bacteria B42]HHJ39571.1 flagellar protein FlaG [Methylothermaceae bacterium]